MKKKLTFFFTVIMLITVGLNKVNAQATDSIRDKRIATLEKIISKLPKVSGLVDFRYQYNEPKESNSFDVRRARLDFKGDISKMFDYRLQVELASSPKILDAYMRVKIKPYFNIQAGSFKTPFSLENPYSPKNLEFIDNAMAISELAGYSDLSGVKANGRDVGIMIYGGGFGKRGFNIVEYSLAVFNGAGINVVDNNKGKDIVGKLEIRPIKALTLSASAYLGWMNVPDTNIINGARDRYAFGVRYDDGKFIFRAEYLNGLSSVKYSESYTNGLMRSSGGYAVIGYTFIDKITPAFRFDIFQKDIHKMATRQINYSVGCSYWINKHFRCQVNYTYLMPFKKESRGSLVSAMFTAAF